LTGQPRDKLALAEKYYSGTAFLATHMARRADPA
jgi:hypothetical protein